MDLLIVFVILLLGLILCSFLGGKGCIEGFASNSMLFIAPNQATITMETGTNNLVMTNPDGTIIIFTLTTGSTYTGPSGETAQLSNGQDVVNVTDSSGTITKFELYTSPKNASSSSVPSSSNVQSTSYDNYNHYSGTSYPTTFYGPNGGTAQIIKTPSNNTIVVTNKNGTTEIYYINNNSGANVSTYYGPNGGSAQITTDNSGKQVVEVTTPNGSKVFYTGSNAYTYNNQDDTINQYSPDANTTGSDYNSAYNSSSQYGGKSSASTVSGPSGNTYSTYDSSAYYNSLPQGIPKSQIVPGEEALYILKSEVVPPVCPKCPNPIIQSSSSGNDTTKCPPCPPCSRCPEPAFDCVKRPNYNAFNADYMPVPVLNDFSTFGM